MRKLLNNSTFWKVIIIIIVIIILVMGVSGISKISKEFKDTFGSLDDIMNDDIINDEYEMAVEEEILIDPEKLGFHDYEVYDSMIKKFTYNEFVSNFYSLYIEENIDYDYVNIMVYNLDNENQAKKFFEFLVCDDYAMNLNFDCETYFCYYDYKSYDELKSSVYEIKDVSTSYGISIYDLKEDIIYNILVLYKDNKVIEIEISNNKFVTNDFINEIESLFDSTNTLFEK